MFKSFLAGLRERLMVRHFWRRATFSEISALYTSKILRLLAINLVSTFILVFMYLSGYSMLYIIIYSAYYTLLCSLFTPLAAVLTAQFGAKKVLLLSSLIYIPALFFLSQVELGATMITTGGFLQALAVTLYQISHDVIFSEVKSVNNAGKEIGYMTIFEKATAIVSPLIGGVISGFFNPQITIWLASVLFLASIMPLFQAQETAKKSHYFSPATFPIKRYLKEYFFQISVGFEWLATRIWPLFMVLTIFANQDPYIMIGIFSAFSAIASIFIAFWAGKLMDKSRQHGRIIFHFSSVGNALGVLWRAFIATPGLVAANVIYNDTMVTVQHMAALKAQFMAADRSGSRVVYLMYRHLAWNCFCFLACLVLILLLLTLKDQILALRMFLIVAALISSLYSFAGYWMGEDATR